MNMRINKDGSFAFDREAASGIAIGTKELFEFANNDKSCGENAIKGILEKLGCIMAEFREKLGDIAS